MVTTIPDNVLTIFLLRIIEVLKLDVKKEILVSLGTLFGIAGNSETINITLKILRKIINLKNKDFKDNRSIIDALSFESIAFEVKKLK